MVTLGGFRDFIINLPEVLNKLLITYFSPQLTNLLTSIIIYSTCYSASLIFCSCGRVQTGSFLDGAAPNGLFGLGMDKTSVPSILANQGLIPNSFSMCFGSDGTGRISFGDKGSPGQGETPFSLRQTQ